MMRRNMKTEHGEFWFPGPIADDLEDQLKKGIKTKDGFITTTKKGDVMSKREYPGETICRFYMCMDRILLDPIEENKSFGHILIPDGARRMDLGRSLVVAVGPDVKHVKVGDIVFTVADLGTVIEDQTAGKTYKHMPENAIIAIDTEYKE